MKSSPSEWFVVFSMLENQTAISHQSMLFSIVNCSMFTAIVFETSKLIPPPGFSHLFRCLITARKTIRFPEGIVFPLLCLFACFKLSFDYYPYQHALPRICLKLIWHWIKFLATCDVLNYAEVAPKYSRAAKWTPWARWTSQSLPSGVYFDRKVRGRWGRHKLD